MKRQVRQQIIGWVAVALSVAITCFWAFWGISETFHEGWYHDSWLLNVGMMLLQYLGPTLIFMAATLASIRFPRAGGGLHVALAAGLVWFFRAFDNTATFLLIVPLVGLGALHWFGRPRPRRIAFSLAIGLPLLVLVLFGTAPGLRVARRVDDGNLQSRLVIGNGVSLIWAPDGPGWPRDGSNWHDAQRICDCLSEDGLSVLSDPANVWRLPSVDEVVRSMALHGLNSLGVWDPENATASYETRPDKESPLWNVHSPVIYWWTATEVDADRAYIAVYDGQVRQRSKGLNVTSLGFRCVKDP